MKPWHVADVMGPSARGYRPQFRAVTPAVRSQMRRANGGRFQFEKPRIPSSLLSNMLASADKSARQIVKNPSLMGVEPWMLSPMNMPSFREAKERDARIRAEWAANPRRRRGIDPNTGIHSDEVPLPVTTWAAAGGLPSLE